MVGFTEVGKNLSHNLHGPIELSLGGRLNRIEKMGNNSPLYLVKYQINSFSSLLKKNIINFGQKKRYQ